MSREEAVESKKSKFEEVAVSFHYMSRFEDGEEIAITEAEFREVCNRISNFIKNPTNDDEYKQGLKNRTRVTFLKCEEIDNRTFCGLYETAYWGHSYRNSEKGDISADSLNLRKFFFLLYLSNSGKVYIASQYLGGYGGYVPFQETIRYFMSNKKKLEFTSFNSTPYFIENANTKQIEIKFAQKPDIIEKDNIFGTVGAWKFGKQHKNDRFEEFARRDFLSLIGKKKSEIKEEIENIVKKNKLFYSNDREVEECRLLVDIGDGRMKVLYMIDKNNFASKIPVNTTYQEDGHPVYEELKEKILKILEKNILNVMANV